MNKICGIALAKDCVKYDYNIKESILSMLGVCDYVIVSYVDSSDGTIEIINSIDAPNLKILYLTESDWNFYNDKNRLSYVTNIAISEADRMGFQYVLYVQADECVHESSYDYIRKAVNDNEEAYLCRRVNLWKTPFLELDVSNDRLPCSNYIIRLAKSKYRSIDDAESINAPAGSKYINDIKIWHYGFVRNKNIMKDKIINMQCGVFGMNDFDPKLNQSDLFNPDLWFNPDFDLKNIEEKHPKIMEKWISTRP